MQSTPLRANDELVSELRKAISSGSHDLRLIPDLIKLVLRDGAWRERIVRATGKPATFQQFVQFVTTPPLDGLGTDVDTLEKLCSDDLEARKLIKTALKRPRGGQPAEVNRSNVTIQRAQRGTTSDYAVRVLEEKRPDLFNLVMAGEKSPHAAMVEAGLRKKTVSVEFTVEGFARFLLKRFSDAERFSLMKILSFHLDTSPDYESGPHWETSEPIVE